MILLETLALIALVSIAEPGFVAGDLTFDETPDLNNGKNIEATALDAGELNKAVDAAKQIDPAAGGRLESALDSGSLKVGVLPASMGSNYGLHDWNTIGVGMAIAKGHPNALAITLLHEFEHVEACNGGLAIPGGHVKDPRVPNKPNPCGPKIHMEMNGRTLAHLCARCNHSSVSEDEKLVLCRMIVDVKGFLKKSYDSAKGAGCPDSALPAPHTYHPPVCECNC